MTRINEATNLALLRAGKLYTYTPGTGTYQCPGDQGVMIDGSRVASVRSYSLNSFMGGRSPDAPIIPPSAVNYIPFFTRESELQRLRTSEMWVFADEDERSINDGCFITDPNGRVWWDFPAISPVRHRYSSCVTFVDGHHEVFKYKDPRTRIVAGTGTEQSGNIDLERLARGATVRR
jgi:hypothetical protein